MFDTLTPNRLVLGSISPARHEKFSQNLFRWLKKNRTYAEYAQVWRDEQDTLWIGYQDGTFFTGGRLMQVLCHGPKTKVFAYPLNRFTKLTQVEGFWERYMEIGRCAIDTNHAHHFLNADNRWLTTGKRRTCQWCGHQQRLRSRKIVTIRHEWVASPSA
jgi:hypothetical protein